jgi:hypothetical protein
MDSFFLSETLVYLYLAMAPADAALLHYYVLNLQPLLKHKNTAGWAYSLC